MYNLLEYSKNYSKTSGSLWKHNRNELTDEANDDTNRDYDVNKKDTKKVETAVPLKRLSYFWKTLDIPLINSEVYLILSWSANCVITSLEKGLDNPAVYDNTPTNATFKITYCKLYVSVVTLSAENYITFRAIKNRI